MYLENPSIDQVFQACQQVILPLKAAQAAKDSTINLNNPDQVHSVIVVDCISRVLFLDKNFHQELTSIRQGIDIPNLLPEGILSLGEISFYGDELLEFFNKTTVVATLYHQN